MTQVPREDSSIKKVPSTGRATSPINIYSGSTFTDPDFDFGNRATEISDEVAFAQKLLFQKDENMISIATNGMNRSKSPNMTKSFEKKSHKNVKINFHKNVKEENVLESIQSESRRTELEEAELAYGLKE